MLPKRMSPQITICDPITIILTHDKGCTGSMSQGLLCELIGVGTFHTGLTNSSAVPLKQAEIRAGLKKLFDLLQPGSGLK